MTEIEEFKANTILSSESHITVTKVLMSESELIQDFRDACKKINVKPVIVSMPVGGGLLKVDLMTSIHHQCSFNETIQEIQSVSKKFADLGFSILREKVELPAFCVEAQDCASLGIFKYFETHFEFNVADSVQEKKILEFSKENGVYFSYNIDKQDKKSKILMVTVRSKKPRRNDYHERVVFLTQRARHVYDIPVIKAQSEMAIYDSNVSHDSAWVSAQ